MTRSQIDADFLLIDHEFQVASLSRVLPVVDLTVFICITFLLECDRLPWQCFNCEVIGTGIEALLVTE